MANKIKIDPKAWVTTLVKKFKALPKNKQIAYEVLVFGVILIIIGLLI